MRGRWLPALLGSLLLGCGGGGGGGASTPPNILLQTFIRDVPGSIHFLTVNFATSLKFAPDGRLFFTERSTGKIQVFENGALTTFATLPVVVNGEQGLLGMAFDPDYTTNKWIYFSHSISGPDRLRVVRFTDSNGVGEDLTVIIDSLPLTQFHNGGKVAFGSDGKLYVSGGDNGVRSNSQNPSSLSGKIHRFNKDGTIPSDNPVPGNPMYCLGIRNCFGIAWHPTLGTLYGSDNGENCDDEVNRYVPNGNYGWRDGYVCGENEPGFISPLARMNPSIAPTGVAFYTGTVFPEWQNNLLMTSWNDRAVRRYALNGAGTAVVTEEILVANAGGGLTDITIGPDGNIYMSGSNGIYRIVRQ
jgi:aldose sugar dehydrogenase